MATSNSIARSAGSRAPGRPIDLGPTEYRLLEFFLEHPGRVFSREQLLDSVWGRDIYIDERTVDVHIGRLRKLLNPGREQDPIRTVRGAGYALDDRFAKATSKYRSFGAAKRYRLGFAASRGEPEC